MGLVRLFVALSGVGVGERHVPVLASTIGALQGLPRSRCKDYVPGIQGRGLAGVPGTVDWGLLGQWGPPCVWRGHMFGRGAPSYGIPLAWAICHWLSCYVVHDLLQTWLEGSTMVWRALL